jgi:hypothetical protein
MISTIAKFGHTVCVIYCDGEGAFGALQIELQDQHIEVNILAAGSHNPVIDRKIRQIKEWARSIIHGLPYKLPGKLIKPLLYFVVSRINLFPSAHSDAELSPRQLLTGRTLSYLREIRCGFGDFVECRRAVTDNTLAPRTDTGIVLYPTGNRTGSYYIYILETDRVVARDQFKVILPTEDLISRVEALGDTNQFTSSDFILTPHQLDFRASTSGPDHADADHAQADPALEQHHYNDFIIDAQASDVDPELRPYSNYNDARDHQNDNTDKDYASLVNYWPRPDHPHDPGDNTVFDDNPEETTPHCNFHSRSVHTVRVDSHHLREDLNPAATFFTYHISAKEGLRLFGKRADAAIQKEMKQMLDLEVFDFIDVKNHKQLYEDNKPIRSFIFLKEKRDGTIKARFTASGNQQDRDDLGDFDTSAYAASYVSIKAILAIAAAEGRKVLTFDVPGAYLHAAMPANHVVILEIDKIVSEILLKINPELTLYLSPRGTLLVRLKKALYGTVQAAKLWFDELSRAMKEFGFVSNPVDQCVYNIVNQDRVQMTTATVVDDGIITCVDETFISEFIKFIDEKYGKVTVKSAEDGQIDFCSIHVDFREPGVAKLHQPKLIDNIADLLPDLRPATAPHTENLFEDDPNAVPLAPKEHAFFRTILGKIGFVGGVTRNELELAVNWLATKQNAPTDQDMNKLKHAAGFLCSTRDDQLRLEGEHFVTVYVDASFAPHKDRKSHSGVAVFMGKGCITAQSTKQKINTKSSAEAELVALSDKVGLGIHLRNFLRFQEFVTEECAVKINEDNKACLDMVKAGKPNSDRSRHVDIRYFWCHDRIKTGDMVVNFVPTEEMIADVLTKPLTGKKFSRARAALLNLK